MLEQMEAAELLALMEKVQQRLKALGTEVAAVEMLEPVELYIDQRYTIRMGAPDGPVLPLRPLVKALFILFLRHPEGILLSSETGFGRNWKIYTLSFHRLPPGKISKLASGDW